MVRLAELESLDVDRPAAFLASDFVAFELVRRHDGSEIALATTGARGDWNFFVHTPHASRAVATKECSRQLTAASLASGLESRPALPATPHPRGRSAAHRRLSLGAMTEATR